MVDLIIKAAVKEQLDGMNVAADFYDVLDTEVAEVLEDAAERAEANDRKTVQPRDLFGFDFLALRRPTIRDAGWTVGGILAFFVLYGALNLVISTLGVPVAKNQVAQVGAQNPEVLLLLVPFSLLFVGPGEELLFRGLIQGTLRRAFRPWRAILLASTIFAVSHATALSGDGQLTYMAIVFVLALVLGAVYEHVENLVIPAMIHGVYNAVLFAALYFQAT